MRATVSWIAWLVAVAGAAPAAAQAPLIRAELDTTAMTLGDRLHLTITVEHSPDATVVWPDSVKVGPFELVDATRQEPRTNGNRTRTTAVLTLTAFELGELEIPSIEVTLSPPDGEPTILSTDPMRVSVVSVGRDESGDIRDVKGPLDMPRSWLVVLLWIVTLAAIGATAYLLYRRMGRRPRAPVVAPPAPIRPAHVIAYEALDRLASSGMLERGEVKPYYIAVSNVMRQYVEGRFGVPALELATHEVLDGLAGAGLPDGRYGGFERFFETCDLVKFARYVPSAARSGEIVPEARRLVALTEPPAPAVAGAATAGPRAIDSPSATDPSGPRIPMSERTG